MFLFTKEMAKLLKEIRVKAHLSQTEVGIRIGLKSKNAPKYISNLEAGKITNPTLRTILNYLRACGESWSEFFKHLDAIDFRTRHEKMIAKLPLPPTQRKIQRDAMRYEIGIEFPAKEKPKQDIDFDRLKSRIESKVTPFLIKQGITGNQAALCQKFTKEYFDFMASLNKSGMRATTDRYLRAGLKFNIIHGLRKIINKEIQAEIKRIEAKKPLPSEKQEKMAMGFVKYRIKIEKIEAEVHKLLCELGVPTSWFGMYKAFSRECVKVLRKDWVKNPKVGVQNFEPLLTEIIARWKKGLFAFLCG